MSIQTELTRITNAKAAIKTAIEGKGVTVSDSAKLDAFAALIDSIEAGGGGAITTLHINVTAVNPETMEATFTTDKTPLEMQQASINGPIWCVVTFAAGVMSEESMSFGVPPAWDTINTVAFGSVTLPVHDKNGDNDVTFFISGIPSNDEWIIDLSPFSGS